MSLMRVLKDVGEYREDNDYWGRDERMEQVTVGQPMWKKVFLHFFLTLCVAFVGFYVGMQFIPSSWAIGIGVFNVILLLIVLIKRSRKENAISSYGIRITYPFLYLFIFLDGISLYPLINHYVSAGLANTVLFAFGLSVLLFGSAVGYAYTSKRDFSFLGSFLFMSLIGLLIVNIIFLFVKVKLMILVSAYLGILLFIGYVLYDISRIKKYVVSEEDVPSAVLDLYLDFINIFIDILQILGISSIKSGD